MKFTDIIALAKMGYTPADIRELRAMADETPQTPAKETTPAPAEESAPEPEIPQAVEPAPNEPAAAAQSAAPEPDAKDDKIAALEAKVASMQAENTRRARPEEKPQKTDAQIIEDMARRFM